MLTSEVNNDHLSFTSQLSESIVLLGRGTCLYLLVNHIIIDIIFLYHGRNIALERHNS